MAVEEQEKTGGKLVENCGKLSERETAGDKRGKWQWKCASALWLFNVFLLKFIEKLWTVTFE